MGTRFVSYLLIFYSDLLFFLFSFSNSTLLVRAQGPAFQVSGGAQETELAALEFESDVLQRDETLAGLRVGVVKIMQCGRTGIHAGQDGGETLLGNFVFELGN